LSQVGPDISDKIGADGASIRIFTYLYGAPAEHFKQVSGNFVAAAKDASEGKPPESI
jgi:hypothetical protein